MALATNVLIYLRKEQVEKQANRSNLSVFNVSHRQYSLLFLRSCGAKCCHLAGLDSQDAVLSIAFVSPGPRFLFNLFPTFVISSACYADKSSWTHVPQSRAALHCSEGPSCCWECVRNFCSAKDFQLYLFISFHLELYPKSALLNLC